MKKLCGEPRVHAKEYYEKGGKCIKKHYGFWTTKKSKPKKGYTGGDYGEKKRPLTLEIPNARKKCE